MAFVLILLYSFLFTSLLISFSHYQETEAEEGFDGGFDAFSLISFSHSGGGGRGSGENV